MWGSLYPFYSSNLKLVVIRRWLILHRTELSTDDILFKLMKPKEKISVFD